jgi:deazaflavin-dependent oxidoreductase (nitroreductase family)
MDMEEINRRTIEQFRAGGEIEGMHRERLVLLTTVGRRSGEQRTKPMLVHRDGEHRYVIASNNGAPEHPEWYRNLVAQPQVTVEIDDDTYAATATPLAGDEYQRVWAELKQAYPFLVDHEARAGRMIPVVDLVPNRAG